MTVNVSLFYPCALNRTDRSLDADLSHLWPRRMEFFRDILQTTMSYTCTSSETESCQSPWGTVRMKVVLVLSSNPITCMSQTPSTHISCLFCVILPWLNAKWSLFLALLIHQDHPTYVWLDTDKALDSSHLDFLQGRSQHTVHRRLSSAFRGRRRESKKPS